MYLFRYDVRSAGHFHKIALILFVTLCYGGNSFKECIVGDNPDQDYLLEITWIVVHQGIGVWVPSISFMTVSMKSQYA